MTTTTQKESFEQRWGRVWKAIDACTKKPSDVSRLAAIDAGTKHEQTRAEFLADFNAKAEMEIHPFTPNPSKLAMDPALRELVAMDHDDTIERFSEEPDDTDE